MKEKFSVKISVIVPVYNVEKYLKKCIESLLDQTLKEIQIILVDDGSKDNSGSIIDYYATLDSRILSIHKSNGGISSARNEGIKYVTGEFITFVDSDDWVDIDMYQRMVEAAYNEEADIVSSNISFKKIKVMDNDIVSNYLLMGNVSVCNKIFRFSESIKNEFYFDPNNVAIDIKGCFDLFKRCKRWVIIPGAFYNYRQDNVSYGRSGFSLDDLNCVRLTEFVEKEALCISAHTSNCASYHVTHAKFDIINKAVSFNFKDNIAKETYSKIKKSYIHDIQKVLFKSLRSRYFSKNEKYQLFLISVSYTLFKVSKKAYLYKTSSVKVSSLKI
jgi:glycosyltransferase involved in cell wall biosynthesis